MSTNQKIFYSIWLLWSIRIRQAASRVFDLTRLGTGSLERLCSALIIGAAFFFATLFLARLAGLEVPYVLCVAFIALATIVAASAVLVLWRSDSQLATDAPKLKNRLAELREQAAAERAAKAAAEAQRAAEEAARPLPTTKPCPYCQEAINIDALKC